MTKTINRSKSATVWLEEVKGASEVLFDREPPTKLIVKFRNIVETTRHDTCRKDQ